MAANFLPSELEKLKSEFDGDPKLRDEFDSFESYVAYKEAMAEGLVKVMGEARAS